MFFWISGCEMTDATSPSAPMAAAETLGCVSCRHSISLGTAAGRQRPTWRGARRASVATSCRLLSFFFHVLSPIASSSAGMSRLTPCGAMFVATALAAPSAASRTATCVSPIEPSTAGMMCSMYGSNAALRWLHSRPKVTNACSFDAADAPLFCTTACARGGRVSECALSARALACCAHQQR